MADLVGDLRRQVELASAAALHLGEGREDRIYIESVSRCELEVVYGNGQVLPIFAVVAELPQLRALMHRRWKSRALRSSSEFAASWRTSGQVHFCYNC